jgi:hypothetical protein
VLSMLHPPRQGRFALPRLLAQDHPCDADILIPIGPVDATSGIFVLQ